MERLSISALFLTKTKIVPTHLRTDWDAAKYLNFFFVEVQQARDRVRPLVDARRPAAPGLKWKKHKNKTNNNHEDDIHNPFELQAEVEFSRGMDTFLKMMF